jgi:hypothetical protein
MIPYRLLAQMTQPFVRQVQPAWREIQQVRLDARLVL